MVGEIIMVRCGIMTRRRAKKEGNGWKKNNGKARKKIKIKNKKL